MIAGQLCRNYYRGLKEAGAPVSQELDEDQFTEKWIRQWNKAAYDILEDIKNAN